MTIYYANWPSPPRQLVSVHPGVFGGWLAYTWTVRPDGTWDQSRPERRPCLASAVSLVPPGAQELPVPPDFAARLFEVRS